jgi:hypothetical protein
MKTGTYWRTMPNHLQVRTHDALRHGMNARAKHIEHLIVVRSTFPKNANT